MARTLRWSVADTEDTYVDRRGNARYRVVKRCSTRDSAEAWVDAYKNNDPNNKVARGVFEICGPEEG